MLSSLFFNFFELMLLIKVLIYLSLFFGSFFVLFESFNNFNTSNIKNTIKSISGLTLGIFLSALFWRASFEPPTVNIENDHWIKVSGRGKIELIKEAPTTKFKNVEKRLENGILVTKEESVQVRDKSKVLTVQCESSSYEVCVEKIKENLLTLVASVENNSEDKNKVVKF